MREGLAQWDFVIAAYGVGIVGTVAMVAWVLAAMWRAERRRDESRRR